MSPYFHELKILPKDFETISSGVRTFEILLNNRDYKVGDLLILQEWRPLFLYTGREAQKYVTHILQSEFLKDGYIGLSLSEYPVLTEFTDHEDCLDDSCLFELTTTQEEEARTSPEISQKILYVPVTRKVILTTEKIAQKLHNGIHQK